MKIKLFSVLFILLFITACNPGMDSKEVHSVTPDTELNPKEYSREVNSVKLDATNNPKENLGEIYSVALDSIMEQDKGLNDDVEYIAIDMSNFVEIDNSDKEEILNYFKEKYKVEVMDATFEQLKEKGLYNPDTMSINGVLLRIEKVDYRFNNNIFFEGSKYRSAKGAIGVEVTVHYKDKKWKAKKVKKTWMS